MEEPDPVLSDGAPLLEDPRFWSMHYYQVLEEFEDPLGDLPDFDAGQELADELCATETEDAYSVYRCAFPLAGECSLELDVVALSEDFQVEASLVKAAQRLPLAVFGGHFRLPALRWEELLRLVAGAPQSDPVQLGRLFLVLLPGVAFGAIPPDALERTQQAWSRAGLSPSPEFVRASLQLLICETDPWTQDSNGAWLSLESDSFRSADSPPQVRAALEDLLGSLCEQAT